MVREKFGPDAFACRNFKRDSGEESTDISLRVKKKTRTFISRGIVFLKRKQLQPPNRLHTIEMLLKKPICQVEKAKKCSQNWNWNSVGNGINTTSYYFFHSFLQIKMSCGKHFVKLLYCICELNPIQDRHFRGCSGMGGDPSLKSVTHILQ